jgi:hypothetical protein
MRKKLIASAIAGGFAVGMLALQGAASAGPSPCGAIHGAFANVNGNFGEIGQDRGDGFNSGVVGQDPGATGYNNSTASQAC